MARVSLFSREPGRRLAAALAIVGVCGWFADGTAVAQTGPDASLTRVRLAEISRREIYLPLYGALRKGLFREEGLDVRHELALGPDRTLSALLSGEADIAMAGPETAILMANTSQPATIRIIAALSRFDGTFLVSRRRIAEGAFKWEMLKGRTVMGWRAGSMPGLFFEHVLRRNGIDPQRDIDYQTKVPMPARARVWRDGGADFATFYGLDVARIEREGTGYAVVAVGKAAVPSVYTVFLTTAAYVEKHPEAVQRWANAIQKGLSWAAATTIEDATATVAAFLPRTAPADITAALRRYRALGFWQTDPTVAPQAIADVQTMMIESGIMPPDRRVPYEAVVEPRFAENAKRAAIRR